MADIRDPKWKYSRAFVTDEDLELANTIHKYIDDKVMDNRQNLDGGFHRDETLARSTFDELAIGLNKIGIQKAFLPKEYGGLGLESNVTYSLLVEELGRGDLGFGLHFVMIPWAFTPAMMTENKAILERYAPMFCGDEVLSAAFQMTEPAGGTNIEDPTQHGSTIQTRAELRGDEWIINGQKLWASNNGVSEFYTTVCTVDPKKGDDGICIISIPKESEGLSFGKPESKMGMVWTDYNGAMYLDNVRVPKGYCVAAPGGEGANIFRYMVNNRFGDGAMAIGGAQACLEIAEDYTKDRFIVGKPVREQSLHAAIIGEMAMKIRAARSFYLNVAYMFDHPELYGEANSDRLIGISSSSKTFSTRVAIEVMHKSMELMGSAGYCADYHIEKYLRDVLIIHLWMGGPQLAMLESARVEYPMSSFWKKA